MGVCSLKRKYSPVSFHVEDPSAIHFALLQSPHNSKCLCSTIIVLDQPRIREGLPLKNLSYLGEQVDAFLFLWDHLAEVSQEQHFLQILLLAVSHLFVQTQSNSESP